MTYAARYPDQVAGLVLLDSSSPEQFNRMPDFPGQYAMMMRRPDGLLPILSRLGIGHLIPGASLLPALGAHRHVPSPELTARHGCRTVASSPRVV
jgi:pimeloyl-ACP methyl ester carboxylesterase